MKELDTQMQVHEVTANEIFEILRSVCAPIALRAGAARAACHKKRESSRYIAIAATIALMTTAACAQTTGTRAQGTVNLQEAIEVIKQCRSLPQLFKDLRLDSEEVAKIMVTEKHYVRPYVNYAAQVAEASGISGRALQRFKIAVAAGLYASAISTQEFGRNDPVFDEIFGDLLLQLEGYFTSVGLDAADASRLTKTVAMTFPKERPGYCVQ